MKKRTYNMDKNMFVEKSILLSKVKELSKYYNKEVIDTLTSMIMLEESVFRHIDFGETFGNLDIFFEIAKHNICNRTIQTIDQMDSIDSAKMEANFFGKGLNIFYTLNDKECFYVFQSSFDQEIKKPYVLLFESTTPVSELIKSYQSSIDSLKGTKYGSDAQFGGYTKKGEPCYIPVFGGPNSQQYFADKRKIERLEERIAELQSYGDVQSTTCNKVTDVILQDWNIEFKKEPFNGLVRILSWIDINKNRIK